MIHPRINEIGAVRFPDTCGGSDVDPSVPFYKMCVSVHLSDVLITRFISLNTLQGKIP